uniref:Uncharacterized protein n=1 Tax=Lactuca sativa TaxID=4236 RepID=A0A9R1XGK2_LACSA|nr:hypothetical protein LSAT_V11C400163140 [Lactuca sativa]
MTFERRPQLKQSLPHLIHRPQEPPVISKERVIVAYIIELLQEIGCDVAVKKIRKKGRNQQDVADIYGSIPASIPLRNDNNKDCANVRYTQGLVGILCYSVSGYPRF